MSESLIESIFSHADELKIGTYASNLPGFIDSENMSPEQLEAVDKVLSHLCKQKNETIIATLLKMSRLPLKEPKTFESFDYTIIHGKQMDALKNLKSLSAVYARKNLAFIGPQGVGKTRLAMAYGRECCNNRLKSYFIKATELNQKFVDAVKFGHEGSTINGLVKQSSSSLMR